MQSKRLAACAICAALTVAVPSTGIAAPVTFSGTVTYDGAYTADTLYAMVVDPTGDSRALGFAAVPAGSPPLSLPYSIDFDNAGLVAPVVVGAVLDVDGSGFDSDSLDTVQTNGDLLGWYDGQQDPLLVDAATSRSGLDYAIATGEIRGNVTFASGQTWAEIEALSLPNLWSPQIFAMAAEGTYALVGLYPGEWIIAGDSAVAHLCYGDPLCASPTAIDLAPGEVRTGIDLDFSTVAVEAQSWGAIKELYR